MLVDTLWLMLVMIVHGADVQDRDGAPDVLKSVWFRLPWLPYFFRPRVLGTQPAAFSEQRVAMLYADCRR